MRRRRPARDLRIAIDCMPISTRLAMVEGIEANRIIAGAYTDRDGGVCPMLAAHRSGGRTSLASFARAWDRYTGARRRARPATARELNTLRVMLEASIALEQAPSPEEPRLRKRDTGERNRAGELALSAGLGLAPPVSPPRRIRPRDCGARPRSPRVG